MFLSMGMSMIVQKEILVGAERAKDLVKYLTRGLEKG